MKNKILILVALFSASKSGIINIMSDNASLFNTIFNLLFFCQNKSKSNIRKIKTETFFMNFCDIC